MDVRVTHASVPSSRDNILHLIWLRLFGTLCFDLILKWCIVQIGVMVMVHGDNKGLVLPPRVATVQVVCSFCWIWFYITRYILICCCGCSRLLFLFHMHPNTTRELAWTNKRKSCLRNWRYFHEDGFIRGSGYYFLYLIVWYFWNYFLIFQNAGVLVTVDDRENYKPGIE